MNTAVHSPKLGHTGRARRSRAASASSVLGSCSQREQLRAASRRCAAVSPPMQRMRARSWVERRRLPCAHLAQAHDAQITQPHWQVGRRNLDVSAGKTSRLCDERALRPSGWLPSDEEVDASRSPKCTSPMCSVEHVWRAGSSWSSTMQLQPSVWVEWVMLGLGQCSDRW